MAYLYHLIFADHPEWLDAPVVWGQTPKRMWQDVQLFLERVSIERFPVYTYVDYLDEDDVALPLYSVPLEPLGLAFWYDGHELFDNYREPLRLLTVIQLREFITEEDVDQLIADNYPDLAIPHDMDLGNLLPVVEALLQDGTLSADLNGLPDMIRWVQSATDNPWLDISAEEMAEMGMDDSWDNWEVLTDEWRDAQPVMARINTLLDWVSPRPTDGDDESPLSDQTRFDTVWQVLETAYVILSEKTSPSPIPS